MPMICAVSSSYRTRDPSSSSINGFWLISFLSLVLSTYLPVQACSKAVAHIWLPLFAYCLLIHPSNTGATSMLNTTVLTKTPIMIKPQQESIPHHRFSTRRSDRTTSLHVNGTPQLTGLVTEVEEHCSQCVWWTKRSSRRTVVDFEKRSPRVGQGKYCRRQKQIVQVS